MKRVGKNTSLILIVFFLFFGMGGNSAHAEMILRLYDLPERLTKDENHGYNFYLKELLKEYPHKIDKRYAPIRRNTLEFLRGEEGCIFPANMKSIQATRPQAQNMQVLVSKPVDMVSVYVYVKQGQEIPTKMSDLKDKNIGHLMGDVAPALVRGTSINLHAPPNKKSLLKMLENERIDGIMGFHPDMAISFDKLGYYDLVYSSELALLKLPTHFICYDTPETQEFIDYLDQGIVLMAKDGRAKKYLSRHAEIIQGKSGGYFGTEN